MKTKEFKGIISQSVTKDNNLILNAIEDSCIPFNSWFETHSRLIVIPGNSLGYMGIIVNVNIKSDHGEHFC